MFNISGGIVRLLHSVTRVPSLRHLSYQLFRFFQSFASLSSFNPLHTPIGPFIWDEKKMSGGADYTKLVMAHPLVTINTHHIIWLAIEFD